MADDQINMITTITFSINQTFSATQ